MLGSKGNRSPLRWILAKRRPGLGGTIAGCSAQHSSFPSAGRETNSLPEAPEYQGLRKDRFRTPRTPPQPSPYVNVRPAISAVAPALHTNSPPQRNNCAAVRFNCADAHDFSLTPLLLLLLLGRLLRVAINAEMKSLVGDRPPVKASRTLSAFVCHGRDLLLRLQRSLLRIAY
jgi:hypothetical protein